MMKMAKMKGAVKGMTGKKNCGLLRSLGALLLALSLLAAIPMDAVAATDAIFKSPSVGGDDYAFYNGSATDDNDDSGDVDRSDLKNFLDDVVITDKDGKQIEPDGGTLFVGDQYHIYLAFSEGDVGGPQFEFNADGNLTYQIPKGFSVPAREDQELWVDVDGKSTLIGTYSVNEDGLLTVKLNDEGRQAIVQSDNFAIHFDMDATAQRSDGGDGGDFSFGDAGQKFNFKVMEQPRASVEKTSQFTEDADKKGGVLDYTVKTTVEHGNINDVVVKDVLTPPQTDAFKLEQTMEEDGVTPVVTVTVTTKNADGTEETVTLGPGDYDLEVLPGDPNNPQDKAFQVKLKEDSDYNPLKEGSVLNVTYQYTVEYVEGATDIFWGNVENVANVTGHMPVENPEKPGEMIDSYLDETRSSSVELYVAPPGHGVVSKDQAYSEATHTLHYTLYTVIPAGEWAPLHIYDDMYVQYGGERWYLQEFKDGGRVKDVKVYAKDVPNWVEGWDSLTDKEKAEYVKDLGREGAEEIEVLPFVGWGIPEGYTPEGPKNMKQCARYYNKKSLYVVFGLETDDAWGNWGHWSYGEDRLIITEYDLDMSTAFGETITLVKDPDHLDTSETIVLSPDEVLRAGITNNVNLRFGSYFPGYSVFFNNAEQMSKTGNLRKEDGNVYIDYTVTMNTTDKTVQGYFHDVAQDWSDRSIGTNLDGTDNWNYDTNGNMHAVFYDQLPEGWEYVKDTLYMTAKINNITEVKLGIAAMKKEGLGPLDENGDICAPLLFFKEENGLEFMNLFGTVPSNVTEIAFHYTLQADADWLETAAAKDETVKVLNHAAIKDNKMTHWSANATNDYIPDRLTKTAKRVGDGYGNVLQFTLDINPGAISFVQTGFDDPQTYLFVTDQSTNLEIQPGTIVVKDADTGAQLDYKGEVDPDALKSENDWAANDWGTIPGAPGQFRLVVPNGKHLTVTYHALITQMGNDVEVSNEASIEGQERSQSGYKNTLRVDRMDGGGSAATYELTVKKDDEKSFKALAGAEFEFYLVRTTTGSKEFELEETTRIPVGGTEYSCYSGDDWKFVTGQDGTYKITAAMQWKLSPGHYYILRETKAPEGYVALKEPILFYYGDESTDTLKYGSEYVLPGGTLTVDNTPKPILGLLKVDAAALKSGTDVPLAGAEFALYGEAEEGKPVPDSILYHALSNEDVPGSFAWTDAKGDPVERVSLDPGGTYYLEETVSPDGYRLLEEPVVISVSEEGVITAVVGKNAMEVRTDDSGVMFTLVVPNESAYVLPESGGMGTGWLYALGGALVLTACLALACDVRRRRTRG